MCAKMRRTRALHRLGAFLSALSLCFVLTVPCFAEGVLSGTLYYNFRNSGGNNTSFANDAAGSISVPLSSYDLATFQNTVSSQNKWGFSRARFPVSDVGVYGFYLSFYYQRLGNVYVGFTSPDASMFRGSFVDSSTLQETVEPLTSFETFSTSGSDYSTGVTLAYRCKSTYDKSISSICINAFSSAGLTYPGFYCNFGYSPSYTGFAKCVVTSCRVVSTASNAELDALESMASEIAAQSQLLSQFYGDIVAICNQIYQRLGDIQAAQEEANALFSNVIKLLNTTNGKLDAINMAMSTYFELLINQLKQEGIDTRTAIADAEARLEAYLKPMIDYFNELEEQTGESAATLPGHKTDIDGFNNQGFGIDSDGQTGVAALVPILSAFGWIWSVIALFIGVGVIHILVRKGIG